MSINKNVFVILKGDDVMLLNVQRFICLVIDAAVIYLPSLLITEIMFNRIGGFSVLLAQFLFVIYNAVCVS